MHASILLDMSIGDAYANLGRRILRWLMMGTVSILFSGVAYSGDTPSAYWNVDKLLSLTSQEIELTNGKGEVQHRISRVRLSMLDRVRKALELTSGVKADLYLVTGEKPNAFASNVMTGRNLFAINLPMMNEIGDDVDSLAVLMGHELAHIERNHIKQKMKEAQDLQNGSQAIGILLGLAGVRGAGTLVDLGATMMFGSYSRDQEREADKFGLGFAQKAGFNPYGGVRLFSRMSENSGDKWIPFLNSHPTHAERIQNLRDQIAQDYHLSTESESRITVLEVGSTMVSSEETQRVAAEYHPAVYDATERTPTLHKKIDCKLRDERVIRTTKVDCIQQEGNIQ